MVIWKFELNFNVIGQPFEVQMPKDAVIVSAQLQSIPCAGVGYKPVMWAKCDPEAIKEPRYFMFVGTDFVLPKEGTYLYVSTFQTRLTDGFVWHLLELVS